MTDDFNTHRRDYTLGFLSEDQIDICPFRQFAVWYDEASKVVEGEPNACALATVSSAGEPSVRFVLLKGMTEGGFVFFSHYDSRKGCELSKNNRAALTFYWQELERQVRLEGDVSPISHEESDLYFASRPRSAQIGATVSKQSRVLSGRSELESAVNEASVAFADAPIPRPSTWGGYRLLPARYEFWQGRPDRLHDRLQYRRDEQGGWIVERLWP